MRHTPMCDILFLMKPEAYIKTVLTLIAVLLAVIVFRPMLSPDVPVSAQNAPAMQMTPLWGAGQGAFAITFWDATEIRGCIW